MIRVASDLLRVPRTRRLPTAPVGFDGTLEELYITHIEATLPSADAVASFHSTLVDYLNLPKPLFLIRMMKGTERGQIYSVADGSQFKASDNAPAWWTQAAAFLGAEIS